MSQSRQLDLYKLLEQSERNIYIYIHIYTHMYVLIHPHTDTLKGIYPEFQVIRGFSQKIPAGLLSYDQIHS